MKKLCMLISAFILLVTISSCSKKSHPAATVATETAKPAAVKKPLKTAIPKVIVVNDKVAKRSVDGRYYYDLEGHRYWRNNKDGKYYLFNKSMFDDPAFKSIGN